MSATAGRVLTAVLLVFFSASSSALDIAGSTTMHKRVLEPGVPAVKSATGIDIKVLPVGTGKGLIALAEGKVPAAAASETLDEAIASAKKVAAEAGKSFTVPAGLTFHEVAADRIAVVVHKDNPVSALTKAQLADMHTGKIRNWKEVGGPDLPVKPMTGYPGTATRSLFQKNIMDGAEYADAVIELRVTGAAAAEVGKDKGAVAAISEGVLDTLKGSNVKLVKSPAITRPLGFVTVGKPAPEVQKVIDFFRSPEGKKTIH